MAFREIEVWDKERGKARTFTREEYIATFGRGQWDETYGFDWPDDPPTDRAFLDKMQSQQEVNSAAAEAGIGSILDLPSHDDDESVPLDDLEPREYDDGASA